MGTTTKDAWAQRYDRAAGALLEQPVVAAAQFLRPRGWRQFGRTVACGPVNSLLARTTGRERRVRLPEAYLVAVTDDALHVLQTRAEAGGGPVPRAIRPLIEWERSALEVEAEAEPDGFGTRLKVVPAGGPPVELVGPPGELTARVVRALGATPIEADLVEPAAPPATTAPAPLAAVPAQPAPAPGPPAAAQAAPLAAVQPAPAPAPPAPVRTA